MGLEIAAHPVVSVVAAMSGPANLLVAATTRDIASLYDYVARRVGAIDGVAAVEVAPMLRGFKRAGTISASPGRSA